MTRFHPPYVLDDVNLLAQHSEQLVASAKLAWNEFLRFFQKHLVSCENDGNVLQ